MKIAAIDPGPEQSALLLWDGARVVDAYIQPNEYILGRLKDAAGVYPLVIEKVECFGMPVGAEVFETVYWTGRFSQAYGIEHVARVPRMAVKMHLCHTSRAKDANIRQALVDRLGKPGTKQKPGVTYGISKDLWSALALAVTWWDQNHA